MAELTIHKKLDDDVLSITLTGHLDKLSSPKFEKELEGALDGVKHLVLDMAGLDYISSAGLRTLLALQLTMEKQGDMKILNVGEVVKETFRVTGFCDILTIADSK